MDFKLSKKLNIFFDADFHYWAFPLSIGGIRFSPDKECGYGGMLQISLSFFCFSMLFEIGDIDV